MAAVAGAAGRGFAETKDYRIASLGNVDSGKSTLVGCLSRGLLDDGKGKARAYVLKHAHEQKRGQSSSVAMTLLGYKNGEQVLPPEGRPGKQQNKDFFEVASKSTSRIQMVDLCGHQKYLKSSIYGLTAMTPDCAMVVVGGERGIQRMSREHVGLACALRIPFFIVVTKIDAVPPDVLKETQTKLKRLLKRAGRKAYMVREGDELEGALKCMESTNFSFAPVFEVSCVTGANLDNLREFIKQLAISKTELVVTPGQFGASAEECKAGEPVVTPVASDTDKGAGLAAEIGGPLNMLVDDTYNVPGVGIVVGATVRTGMAQVGQRLFIGPGRLGDYRPVLVRSIHRQCVPSRAAYAGQHATFAIKSLEKQPLKRDWFRKGMVFVGEQDLEQARRQTVREFEANVKVLHHATTIDRGYSPFIHMAGSRQSARILAIRSEKGEEVVARTGSQVLVHFRFLNAPEYVELDRILIFRESQSKGVGRVTRLFDENGDEIRVEPPSAGLGAARSLENDAPSTTNLPAAHAPVAKAPTRPPQQQQQHQIQQETGKA